ncbi:MAG: flagellar assembly protein FliW [Thiomonas sp.]
MNRDLHSCAAQAAADTVTLWPTRFGALPLAARQIWRAAAPLPGFETLQRFALIGVRTERPFVWLQSLDDAQISFLLVGAAHFGLDYPQLPAQAVPLVMVLLPQRPGQDLRAHRQAPLLFDVQSGEFAQHIVEADGAQGSGVFAPQSQQQELAVLAPRLLQLEPARGEQPAQPRA